MMQNNININQAMSYLIAWFLVFLGIKLYAQTDTVRFSRTYQYIPNQNTGCAVIPVQDGFLTCGVAFNPTTLLAEYVIAKLDGFGSVINKSNFRIGIHDNFGKYNAIQFSDNRFFYGGLSGNWSNYESNAILICFDANADTLFTKEYNWSPRDEITCMAKTDSGTIILSGVTSPNGNRQVLFAEIDSLGNVLNYKALGGGQTDYAYAIKKSANGFVIAGPSNTLDSSYNFSLYKVTNHGDSITSKSWGSIGSDYISQIHLFDGQTIVSGGNNYIENIDARQAYIGVLNDSLQIINEFKFFNPQIEGIDKQSTVFDESLLDEDGSFYTNTDVNYTNDSSNMRQLIWKIDTAGNVVWQRKLETELNYWANRNFWSMQRTPDKGFALYGVAFNSPQVAWLVKLDSLGCFVAGCDTITGIKEITLTHGENIVLQSWPNPTNGQFFCSWPQDQNQPTGYRLTNLTGQLVDENSILFGQNHLELNLSNEPSGVYFLSLYDANKILITKKIVKE